MNGMARVSPVVALILLSCVTVGCSNRTPPNFRDLPPAQTGWTEGRRLWSDRRTLHVAIDSDPQGLYVGRIDYEVHNGNLYLATVRQSKPFAPAAFQIDTVGMKLKRPWQDHVYWVADVRWDDVGRRVATVGSTLGQHVDRVKADVSNAEPFASQPVARDTSPR